MYGAMNNQFKVLFRQSEAEFKSFMRLNKSQFFEVLGLIEDDISTDNSTSRDGIPAKEKFMVSGHTAVLSWRGESYNSKSLLHDWAFNYIKIHSSSVESNNPPFGSPICQTPHRRK